MGEVRGNHLYQVDKNIACAQVFWIMHKLHGTRFSMFSKYHWLKTTIPEQKVMKILKCLSKKPLIIKYYI
ncbi:MAG: hypothetical protein CM15mP22_5170 [Gammaproteobacteria bacterium]|nr:MAG: hypothetical protein CM15mP22_5170 [Gammaproteobacteria bacterium]